MLAIKTFVENTHIITEKFHPKLLGLLKKEIKCSNPHPVAKDCDVKVRKC